LDCSYQQLAHPCRLSHILNFTKYPTTKAIQEHPAGKLMPNPIPTEPWKDLSADMIVGLPESKGFNAILVVADRHSKEAHFIPCTNKLISLGLAKLYMENV
jgi:hypothetical protein